MERMEQMGGFLESACGNHACVLTWAASWLATEGTETIRVGALPAFVVMEGESTPDPRGTKTKPTQH